MKTLLVALLSIGWVLSPAYAEQPAIVGEAYRLDSGELWYREKHYFRQGGLEHEVKYVDADGQPVARKLIDYRSGLTSPGFSQQGSSYSDYYAASWQSPEQLLLQYREPSSDMQQGVVEVRQPLVVDAGFDHFIRQHWEALVAGEKLTFNFAAPSRQQLVKLFVARMDCDLADANTVCFRATLDNLILRWFVTPIEVVYAADSRLLQRYVGLANIADEQGVNHKVDIRYQYPAASECDDCAAPSSQTVWRQPALPERLIL